MIGDSLSLSNRPVHYRTIITFHLYQTPTNCVLYFSLNPRGSTSLSPVPLVLTKLPLTVSPLLLTYLKSQTDLGVVYYEVQKSVHLFPLPLKNVYFTVLSFLFSLPDVSHFHIFGISLSRKKKKVNFSHFYVILTIYNKY